MPATVDERPTATEPRPRRDPNAVADAFATATLLRCWVREGADFRRSGDDLVVDLAATGTTLVVPVRYWSACGWHQFGAARLGTGTPADATTVATLLATEVAGSRDAGPQAVADLVGRVVDSTRRIARHVTARQTEQPAAPAHVQPDADQLTPFLDAEQALVLGHPLHPTPKSRGGLTDHEAAAYSPELRGSFALCWFAADPAVVGVDSATGQPAPDLVRDLAPGLDVPEGMVAVPAHPWQAADVLRRPGVRALVDEGRLRALGPAGPAWHPTSSVRTVYRPDAPYMLKLSLGLPITNSKRENLRKELRRGVEMARLLDAGLGAELSAAHPGFGIVTDPAYLGVDVPGQAEGGLDVVVRSNPFGAAERVHCLAGLVAERPDRDGRSLLGELLHALSGGTGRDLHDVGAEWFERYLGAVPEPVLWLYAEHGIGLEAHQQNTLVEVDVDGWPVGGRYRDNQGFYYDRERADALGRWSADVGMASDARCDEELIDERLGYYLGINNVIGLVGAMGSQGLADESSLLRAVRSLLQRVRDEHSRVTGVVRTLLTSPTLPCKANLLTRLEGMDELVGPVATQSVYRQIGNPVAEVSA
jgi:siderophore synthetase component